MRLSLKNNTIIAVGLLLPLAGCADNLNHNDSVTVGLGNANFHNQAVHAIKPFPPEAGNTEIKISAKKTLDALNRYNEPGDPDINGGGGGGGIGVATGVGGGN